MNISALSDCTHIESSLIGLESSPIQLEPSLIEWEGELSNSIRVLFNLIRALYSLINWVYVNLAFHKGELLYMDWGGGGQRSNVNVILGVFKFASFP